MMRILINTLIYGAMVNPSLFVPLANQKGLTSETPNKGKQSIDTGLKPFPMSWILEKKKAVSNSIKVNFFDMPSQLLPEK